MQEYGFIPSIGMNSSEFWKEVRDLTDRENMDGILAYIFKMSKKQGEKRFLFLMKYSKN